MTKAFIKTGVIGHPISHSKSPLIHNHWIKQLGLNGAYEAIDIKPEDLHAELPRLLREGGYTGFNLTIPHKEIAMDICDEITSVARDIGAVNTVKLLDNGKIYGHNTDGWGFAENITKNIPSFNFINGPAVILGAGGAAKAILFVLLHAGVPQIIITNRTREKAEILAAMDSRVTVAEWDDREDVLSDCNLLVNTTALGMKGQPDLDIALDALPPAALVSDIVYAPLMTDLLKNAQQKGNPILTGIGMLLHQARPAFELWYGTMPQVDQTLEDMVLA